MTAVWDEYDVKLQEDGDCYTVIGLNTNKTDIEIKPSYKGKKVTSITDNAFKNCSKITSITIPNSVITIGDYAFYNCSGLTNITIPDSVTTIGDRVFIDCSELTSVIIGKSLSSIVSNSFMGCSKLTNITIGNGITSIGSYAFFGCSGLKNIYINDISAWCNISGLKNLMEDNSINKNLYLHEKLITDLIIPNNVTSIASNAFRNCTGITSVTIPNSVTTIGNSAFYNCKGLTSITIPNSVRTIDYYSFVNCNELKRVYYKGTAAQWREISFELAGDSSLANAARYYYSKTEPALNSDGTAYDGNYWHYDSDGITPVIWKKEN